MNAVYTVILDEFLHPVADQFSDLGQSGIEKERVFACSVFGP